jgi:DNA recombination protein RmuC
MDTNSVILIIGIAIIIFLLFRKPTATNKTDDQAAFSLIQNRINDLSKIVNEQLQKNRESQDKSSQAFYKQINDFATGIAKVNDAIQKVETSVKDVSSFQQIFRVPKLRGRWGELALEHILSQNFPRDMFELQHQFKSGEAVDATLTLPDGKILPIDAKFPHDHFEKMIVAQNEQEKSDARKLFAADVKREIDDIASKYILPAEGTTSVALMYIPAEAVYFEIITSVPELSDHARLKKVFLASPNTFSLMLQVIQQWSRDLQIGKHTEIIIKRIQRIAVDAKKLSESFNKLGKHLSDARSSYEDSDKRLNLFVERTEKLVETESGDQEHLKIEPPSED